MKAEVQAQNEQLFDHSFTGDIDPFVLFDKWLALATLEEPMANAMSLATVDEAGMPDVRMVLLKERAKNGFTFYTNTQSTKGREMAVTPKAALSFFWKSLNWQLRARGHIVRVSDEVADAYFSSRPLGSRIGAHASDQSRPLETKQELVERVSKYEAQFGEDVPRPSHWTGFTIEPTEIEFWCDGEYRLHDRVRFKRENTNHPWTRQRLFP